MKKYDVLCPHCCGTFLETNINFREDIPANGSMFEAKQHIKDAAWSVFPLYDSTEYMDLICPSCEGVLVDYNGKVLRMVEIGNFDPIGPGDVRHDWKQDNDAVVLEPGEPTAPEIIALCEGIAKGPVKKAGRPKRNK